MEWPPGALPFLRLWFLFFQILILSIFLGTCCLWVILIRMYFEFQVISEISVLATLLLWHGWRMQREPGQKEVHKCRASWKEHWDGSLMLWGLLRGSATCLPSDAGRKGAFTGYIQAWGSFTHVILLFYKLQEFMHYLHNCFHIQVLSEIFIGNEIVF